MKIAGITRIRNEENIIKNTLDHVSKLVDDIYVYDDDSTDNTVKICNEHKSVKGVIKGEKWNPSPSGRSRAEGLYRQKVYELAVKNGADWVYYFDSDEYVEFADVDFSHNSYFFRLFDFYITKEDVNDNYLNRVYMGPEYRDIPMLFKVNPNIRFSGRIPSGIGKSVFGGYVKHYGKAISVEEWDKTCDYYINHRWKGVNKELLTRWENRVGKAIHEKSDFGRPLITWSDKTDINKIFKIH